MPHRKGPSRRRKVKHTTLNADNGSFGDAVGTCQHAQLSPNAIEIGAAARRNRAHPDANIQNEKNRNLDFAVGLPPSVHDQGVKS
jgi:hypothetical protein